MLSRPPGVKSNTGQVKLWGHAAQRAPHLPLSTFAWLRNRAPADDRERPEAELGLRGAAGSYRTVMCHIKGRISCASFDAINFCAIALSNSGFAERL